MELVFNTGLFASDSHRLLWIVSQMQSFKTASVIRLMFMTVAQTLL